MQLTKLEIKGFKSFADKVTIHFDDGITGIVGPNGCGKSNVVDAIRWVLGEQKSRILRSDKMENVIFNGTKNRKQTQLAEVSLTFNNTKNLIPTEYTSVTITRRYFRSGESEYLLNGVTCRLKDITNLFLDTGIASNTYAIIELKMVDDLLNDKDNSRRALFEEAAGISKFKIRKKETLRKLDDTDADLERVEDLLFEIEKNLKALERQASQAKKYYQLKDDYKENSVALAKKMLHKQQLVLEEITDKIKNREDEKLSLTSKIRENESKITSIKSGLINKEKTLASRQKTLNDHVSSIRQYESDKRIKNERSNYLNEKIENLSQKIKIDQESIGRMQTSLEGLKRSVIDGEKEVNQALEAVELEKENYEKQKEVVEQETNSYQRLNESFTEKRDRQFQVDKELEIKTVQIQALQSELEKSSLDSNSKNANLEEFEEKLNELSGQKTKVEQKLSELAAQQNEVQEKLLSVDDQLNLEKDELAKVNRQIDSRQNELSLTKSLVENLEGFPEAIKFLKKNKLFTSTPLLSDIVSCPEEYKVPIENYLEYYMNFFIVDTADQAFQGVQLLNETSAGRANFFALDRLNALSIGGSEAVTGKPAMEVIEYDSKYSKLINYLLGDVFIVEKNAAASNENHTLVDKQGVLINGKLMIGGGSVGLFEGKRIGRAKNIDKLSDQIEQLLNQQIKIQHTIGELSKEKEKLQGNQKKSELEELRVELSQLNERYISFKTKKEQFSEILSSNKNRRDLILDEMDELKKTVAHLQPISVTQVDELKNLESLVIDKQSTIEGLQVKLQEASGKFNEQNVIFHQRQNKLDSILQEIGFKEESFQNAKKRIDQNQEELADVQKNLSELMLKTTQGDDELVEMYKERENLEKGVNEAEKAYYEDRSAVDKEEKALKEIQISREEIDQFLLNLQTELNDAKIELNSVRDRLTVEFNMVIETVSEEEIADIKLSVDDLRQKVEKLRDRIENMGPVNPMAMEAYEEIKERHTFITGQKEDLLNAKETLLITIGEIDGVARDTFMEAFEHIKTNFIKVFRTLFTEEDDCDLKLTNPDQPLESTIDIIAKPKGKRPLTINQLSGGEKTLTATSLLFSIYLLKPAPFCIFDEVDAPLDDANIDKFNEIIRKFSKESQFIIVTHNKRTMASTDVIYGVTMQEQGVSRLIPVDLRELA